MIAALPALVSRLRLKQLCLFNRTRQGLEANDLGHCAIRYARLVHTDLAHLRKEVFGILRGPGGRLPVGAVMGAMPLLWNALEAESASQPGA